jgi:hypothetical protein
MLTHRMQNVPRPGHVEDATVTRWIDVPWAEIASALSTPDPTPGGNKISLRDGGALRLDTRFLAQPEPVPRCSAGGRLVGRDLRPPWFQRVEVVVSAWSARAVEVKVVPASAALNRWGARRLARYFRLAHDAADTVAELLERAAHSTTDRKPARRGGAATGARG